MTQEKTVKQVLSDILEQHIYLGSLNKNTMTGRNTIDEGCLKTELLKKIIKTFKMEVL